MNNRFGRAAIWAVISSLILFATFKHFDGREKGAGATLISYSEFLDEVKAKHVKEATIEDRNLIAVTTDGKKVRTVITFLDRGLIGDLVANGVKFEV